MLGSDCILMENIRVGYTSAINRDVESMRMLNGLANSDPNVRRQVFEVIVQHFTDWLNGYDGPLMKRKETLVFRGYDWNNGLHQQSEKTVLRLRQLLRDQLPDILRLKLTCPFSDVREKCHSILHELEVKQRRAF